MANKIDELEEMGMYEYIFKAGGYDVVKHKNNSISIGCIDGITFKEIANITKKIK